MKKLLVTVTALLLVLSLCAGCGNKGSDSADDGAADIGASDSTGDSGEDDDSDYEAESLAWPTADLPDGFPEYTDGIIFDIGEEEFGVFISILETGQEAYEAYLKKLEAAGWVEDTQPDEEEKTYIKGSWMVTISLDVDLVSILASDAGIDFDLDIDYETYGTEWPENLPFKMPQYKDGTIERSQYDGEDKFLSVSITGTSKEAFTKYKDELAKAGWEIISSEQDSFGATLDGWRALIKIKDDGTLTISVGQD
jgi:predicted small lipoprotein YifL